MVFLVSQPVKTLKSSSRKALRLFIQELSVHVRPHTFYFSRVVRTHTSAYFLLSKSCLYTYVHLLLIIQELSPHVRLHTSNYASVVCTFMSAYFFFSQSLMTLNTIENMLKKKAVDESAPGVCWKKGVHYFREYIR